MGRSLDIITHIFSAFSCVVYIRIYVHIFIKINSVNLDFYYFKYFNIFFGAKYMSLRALYLF